MTSIDVGTYGAKVQSWRRANPRDVLKRLIDENPKADRSVLLREFHDLIRGDEFEEYLNSIIEYWFSNNYHSLMDRPKRSKSAPARRAAVSRMVKTIDLRIQQKARTLLLDMVLPNGKKLRDATFAYCAKLGGGLSRLAVKGKPNQTVGEVLTEKQVRQEFAL